MSPQTCFWCSVSNPRYRTLNGKYAHRGIMGEMDLCENQDIKTKSYDIYIQSKDGLTNGEVFHCAYSDKEWVEDTAEKCRAKDELSTYEVREIIPKGAL